MSLGPGDPKCKFCGGQGVIKAPREDSLHLQRGEHPPAYRRCPCVLRRDIIANVERGMRGLSEAPVVSSSPFMERTHSNLWVTATKAWFMAHLRHVAIRHPPTWYFKVVTDADLMTAWLASVALKGKDILDPDAAKVSMTHLTLVDLVEPPELLIVRLGVKAARNVASPEVLLEALHHRDHIGMPTWLWDTPSMRLADGHVSYSPMVGDEVSTWEHITGVVSEVPSPKASTSPGFKDMDLGSGSTGGRPTRLTLSDGAGKKTLRNDEEDDG